MVANVKELTNVDVFMVLKETIVKLVNLCHNISTVSGHAVRAIVQQMQPADVNKDGQGNFVREVIYRKISNQTLNC
jgi:hypothetical protein